MNDFYHIEPEIVFSNNFCDAAFMHGQPKAGNLFFCTKLKVYVSGCYRANKCRQHSQLIKELQYQDLEIIEGAVYSQ